LRSPSTYDQKSIQARSKERLLELLVGGVSSFTNV
jgi:hypothetical protein